MGKGRDAKKTTKKPPAKTAKEKKAAKKLKNTNKENWQEIHINPLWLTEKQNKEIKDGKWNHSIKHCKWFASQTLELLVVFCFYNFNLGILPYQTGKQIKVNDI